MPLGNNLREDVTLAGIIYFVSLACKVTATVGESGLLSPLFHA